MSRTPDYLLLHRELRRRIASGELKVGDMLPSIAQLSVDSGVSVSVVKAALRELAREGLTEGRQGKGVFVIAAPGPLAPVGGEDLPRLVAELAAHVDRLEARLARLERRDG